MNTTNERNTYATEAVGSAGIIHIDFDAIKSIDSSTIISDEIKNYSGDAHQNKTGALTETTKVSGASNTNNTNNANKIYNTNNSKSSTTPATKTDIKYKDRLFSFIFGSEDHKDWTLSLYNAVNESDYKNSDELELNTIKQVLYLGMRNDVSFLIGYEINLYEQQSTYNPNMPLRMLQYLGNLYEKYIKQHKFNKYGKKLISLPVPKLVVFYNGDEDFEDEIILKLSDSFPEDAKPDVEVKVRMININYGHNKKLFENCKPLNEYSWFVEHVKSNTIDMNLDEAIDKAIEEMPKTYTLKTFLKIHRMEVKEMLLTEYDEAEQMELFKEDGRREGRREGLQDGYLQAALKMKSAGISEKLIAESLELSEEEILKL